MYPKRIGKVPSPVSKRPVSLYGTGYLTVQFHFYNTVAWSPYAA